MTHKEHGGVSSGSDAGGGDVCTCVRVCQRSVSRVLFAMTPPAGKIW